MPIAVPVDLELREGVRRLKHVQDRGVECAVASPSTRPQADAVSQASHHELFKIFPAHRFGEVADLCVKSIQIASLGEATTLTESKNILRKMGVVCKGVK